MTERPFLVGIDLGTTNSAVAYVDLRGEGHRRPRPRLLDIPQLVAPGEVEPRAALPSFVYLPTAEELRAGSFDVPWSRERGSIVGALARDRGGLWPTRQVASAKSWLCHPTADRTAHILPWGADPASLSPVEASARVLTFIRDAWDHLFAGAGREDASLEVQRLVLTVPASFDQEARGLTLAAAREAGLEQLTLLEEPLAAFYAWIARHRSTLARHFHGGEQVLVCDVGGGTTDFTLVRVLLDEEGRIAFERTAVGEHLLLGGDNLDLALARRLEQKGGDRALTLVQRLALRRSVSAAKERLLTDPDCERIPITLLGSGRAVVGGAVVVDLERADVIDELTTKFLPEVDASARPQRDKRTGLRELGLPYAEDAAVTRHLAAFLATAARATGGGPPAGRGPDGESATLVRPDAILFNGGFFTPSVARSRVVDTLGRWFDPSGAWRPRVLEQEAPAAAVAMGAAYYGLVLEGGGLRVRAGSARAYYLGVSAAGEERPAPGVRTTVCILPRATEEGSRFDLGGHPLAVMTNRPVSFPLFSSSTRHDRVGEVVSLEPADAHRHAPLATVLRFGKKSRDVQLEVSLASAYTETGTLEVELASRTTEHRWRLQFQLRGEPDVLDADETTTAESESVVSADRLAAAQADIAAVFGGAASRAAGTEEIAPEALPARLESVLGFGRQAWPLAVIRALADSLLQHPDGRRFGPRFEARWLNLLGFCLRPGFGAPLDDWRVSRARAIYVEGLVNASDLQCQAEWIVLWQRVAGGLKTGQQRELYQRFATVLEVRAGKKAKRINAQIQREAWRLLASLEHLSAKERAFLGDVLLDRLARDPENASYAWAIGRFGARVPAYGPATAVVPHERAEMWIERLLALQPLSSEVAAAVAQIGAQSHDPLRDIGQEAREKAVATLTAAGFEAQVNPLQTFVPPEERNALQVFGEALPAGLTLLTDRRP